jgi:hypothetical protein
LNTSNINLSFPPYCYCFCLFLLVSTMG